MFSAAGFDENQRTRALLPFNFRQKVASAKSSGQVVLP